MRLLKININLGQALEDKVIEDPRAPEYLSDPEIYWRLGVGRVAQKDLAIERRKSLEGFEYRYGNQLMKPSDIECWSSSEYMDWRDS